MGASGAIYLVSSSTTPTSETTETVPVTTGDIYTFDNVDLTFATSFTLTGNFDDFFGGDFGVTYASSFLTTPQGSMSIDANDGTFTYTVDKADLVTAGQTTVSINIQSANFSTPGDDDTLTFNFTLCFASGTLIHTPTGECRVENLGIGDPVTAADGRTVPVKWVGHVTVDPMFNPADRLDPVRIRKGALGPNVPHTDLIVTADHGMVLGGLVINASALVNGTTIDWLPWKTIGTSLTYYHVETEGHDVILAHGAASETYLDIPDRQSFDNHAEFTALYGDVPPMAESTLPRITSARLLPDALRTQLGIDQAKYSCAS